MEYSLHKKPFVKILGVFLALTSLKGMNEWGFLKFEKGGVRESVYLTDRGRQEGGWSNKEEIKPISLDEQEKSRGGGTKTSLCTYIQ